MNRLFGRAVALRPVSWLSMFAVFVLFLWLNFNSTRVQYLQKTPDGWRGGIREGFPTAWWDGGSVATGVAGDKVVMLRSTPYGGWQPGGIALGVLTLSAALLAAASLSETIARRSRRKTDPQLAFDPLRRPVRIRLMTGLVSLVLLGGAISLNLIVTTSINSDSDGTPGPAGPSMNISQSMGWPFQTYIAHNPVLVSATQATGAVLTVAQETAFMELNEPVRWTRAHWSSTGIVLDAFSALFLVGAAAAGCEWAARRSR
jgi:hypothetical protein